MKTIPIKTMSIKTASKELEKSWVKFWDLCKADGTSREDAAVGLSALKNYYEHAASVQRILNGMNIGATSFSDFSYAIHTEMQEKMPLFRFLDVWCNLVAVETELDSRSKHTGFFAAMTAPAEVTALLRFAQNKMKIIHEENLARRR